MGSALYREIFSNGNDHVRILRDKLNALQTPLLISTNAPDIYWELLFLEDAREFLGLKYDVGRRLHVADIPDVEEPGAHKWRCLMIVNPNEGDKQLEAKDLAEKSSSLEDWFKARDITCDCFVGDKAISQNIIDNLAKYKYDIIHYAGHISKKKNTNEYVLLLNKKDHLTATNIRRHVQGSPIVFLNGCWGGQARSPRGSTRPINEMTNAFLGAGARVVVGSLFELPEKGAGAFAEKFYESVLFGKTFGEAMREARKHVKDKSNYGAAWACYVMYGDPSLRIVQQNNVDTTDDGLRELLEKIGLRIEDFDKKFLTILIYAYQHGKYDGRIDAFDLLGSMVKENHEVIDILNNKGISPNTIQELLVDVNKIMARGASPVDNITLAPNVEKILLEAHNVSLLEGCEKVEERHIFEVINEKQMKKEIIFELEKIDSGAKKIAKRKRSKLSKKSNIPNEVIPDIIFTPLPQVPTVNDIAPKDDDKNDDSNNAGNILDWFINFLIWLISLPTGGLSEEAKNQMKSSSILSFFGDNKSNDL
jgi:hypothetical protein